MAMSTEELNTLSNKRICERLGVDEFSYEFEKQFSEEPFTEAEDTSKFVFGKETAVNRNFRRQFIKFKKNGKTYRFCIEPVVKTERWSQFPMSGVENTYNWEAMEKEATKIITEFLSNQKYVNQATIP
jgi:hypothetical protein